MRDWEHAGYTAILVGAHVLSAVDLELLSTLLGVVPVTADQRLEVFIPAAEPELGRARDILEAFRAATKQ